MISGKKFRENCNGHGRNLVGRCKCDRLYYGELCQFRDECFENSDCGDHGKCINIDSTEAPRQQCYCQLGWFGPGCNKRESPYLFLLYHPVYHGNFYFVAAISTYVGLDFQHIICIKTCTQLHIREIVSIQCAYTGCMRT